MDHMNFEKITKGLIPWTSDEFNEIKAQFHAILQKPKDDWDIETKKTFLPDEKKTKWDTPGLDPYHPMAQLKILMIKKYPDQEKAMAHFFRYNKIIKFLQDHELRLRKEKLMQQGKNPAYIKNELIECLCTMPYATKKETFDNKNEYKFCYNTITEKTKELIDRKSQS